MTSHYETLGIDTDASAKDVKTAFRKLAKGCHPDVAGDDPDAEQRFKEINAANEVLSDPEKRAAYDMRNTPTPGFIGFDPFERVRNMAQRGANVGVRTTIDFMDAIRGTEVEVEAPEWLMCKSCTGEGRIDTGQVCDHCDGQGRTQHVLNNMYITQTCFKCSGTGKIFAPCLACRGSGFTVTPRKLKTTVPPGVDQGSVLRLRGQGRPGKSGGPAGDLLVQISVIPHQYFIRKGSDIHVNVPISYKTACLGGEETVPTLEGDVKVTIPVGTPHGSDLRLAGKGLSIAGCRPGNQHCHVMIDIIDKPTPGMVEALEVLEILNERRVSGEEIEQEKAQN